MKRYPKDLSEFRKEEKAFNAGIRLRNEGRLEEAAQVFKEIANRHPRVAAPLGLLGGIYNELGRFHEAAGCYRRAVEINPSSELANRGLVNALWSLGEEEKAIQVIERYKKEFISDAFDEILEAYRQREAAYQNREDS